MCGFNHCLRCIKMRADNLRIAKKNTEEKLFLSSSFHVELNRYQVHDFFRAIRSSSLIMIRSITDDDGQLSCFKIIVFVFF